MVNNMRRAVSIQSFKIEYSTNNKMFETYYLNIQGHQTSGKF